MVTKPPSMHPEEAGCSAEEDDFDDIGNSVVFESGVYF